MVKSKKGMRYLACGVVLMAAMMLLFSTMQALADTNGEIDSPNLVVEKDANTENAEPGEVVTFSIQIMNTGSHTGTVSVWMTDSLPSELDYIDNSLSATFGDFSENEGVITWTAEMFGYNYTAMITFSAAISPEFESGDIINTVEVTGAGSLELDEALVSVAEEPTIFYLPIIVINYPPIPVLNDIPEPDENDDYRVSWTAVEVSVDHYVLQEATDTGFNTVTDEWQTSLTYVDINKDEDDVGTFYYRVRADDGDKWGDGPWSNVESVDVGWEYFDDFSDYQSGWPREWSSSRGALYQVHPNEHKDCPGDDCGYDDGDGYVIARRSQGSPSAKFGPGVAIPSDDYEITFDSRWYDAAYYATYKVYFGSDNPFTDEDNLTGDWYALQVRINVDENFCDYQIMRHWNTRGIESSKILNGDYSRSDDIKCDVRKSDSNAKWDHWRIKYKDDKITLYVNDEKLGSWEDNHYGKNRYFGVGATLYEGFTPSKPIFDNWKVTLLTD